MNIEKRQAINFDLEDKKIYITVKDSDFEGNSKTFWCTEETKKDLIAKYEAEVIANHKKLMIVKNFNEANKSLNINDYIKKALNEGYKVFYNYDLMGCGEIIRVNKKSFTMLDICDYKNYLKFEWVQKNIIFDAISIECN